MPCLCDPYCPEWRCCSPDPGDRGIERSKRKSPAKRRFPVPVSPGKMGTIYKGDFRLHRSIPRSPGSPGPRQDAFEHIHAPRSVACPFRSAKRKAAAVSRCTRNILCQRQQYFHCGCGYYAYTMVGSFHLMASLATSGNVACGGRSLSP